MISHDMPAAIKYASHILHLGTEVFYGTKEDYLKWETGKQPTMEEGSGNI